MSDQPQESLSALKTLLENVEDEDETPDYEYEDLTFQRHGESDIRLPEGLALEDAEHAIKRRREEMEQTVMTRREFDATYPPDGFVALKKAIQNVFGYASHERVVEGMFGERQEAPRSQLVQTGPDALDSIRVFVDRIKPPALEGGYIEPHGTIKGGWPTFFLTAEIKKRHRAQVDALFEEVQRILSEESIYRGQAIEVNLGYALGEDFDVKAHEPSFMDVADLEPLILNEETERLLETSVIQRIRHPDVVREMDVPLGHGVVLSGPYGTGKTLTARHIAQECVENGWTFVLVDDIEHLEAAFQFAENYSPAVVFGEDVDRVTDQRDDSMNRILNAIDGIQSKGREIVTVLTTNHPDEIEASFMRAGRIDCHIPVGRPNPDTVKRFIQVYAETDDGASMLADDADLEEASKTMQGFVPSFIAEGVRRAKMYALSRAKEAGTEPVITGEDLYLAGQGLKHHAEMASMEEDEQPSPAEAFVEDVSERTAKAVKNGA